MKQCPNVDLTTEQRPFPIKEKEERYLRAPPQQANKYAPD